MSICQHMDKPGIDPDPHLCVRWETAWGMTWLIDRAVNLSSIIYRVPRLRMSGAMYLLPLYAFMAWTCQHYVFLEKRLPAWHWELRWIVIGYCYVVTPCTFECYIERIWKIFFCCPHRTAVVMFVFNKNCCVTRNEIKFAWYCHVTPIIEFTRQISADKK
jgi:hypothetical protein